MGKRGTPESLKPEQYEQFVEDAAKLKLTEVADLYGMCAESVRNWLKRLTGSRLKPLRTVKYDRTGEEQAFFLKEWGKLHDEYLIYKQNQRRQNRKAKRIAIKPKVIPAAEKPRGYIW